jgi:hypothetical protein
VNVLITHLFVVLYAFKVDPTLAFLITLGTALFLDFGKEIADKYRSNGTGFDWNDLNADLWGFLAGVFLIAIEVVIYIGISQLF